MPSLPPTSPDGKTPQRKRKRGKMGRKIKNLFIAALP
jgi:hypothetical protein